MELWIRSQDKERLIRADNLHILKSDKRKPTYRINSLYHSLGAYETKERALEVLNEIQSILDFNDIRGIVVNANRINSYVYEMPED